MSSGECWESVNLYIVTCGDTGLPSLACFSVYDSAVVENFDGIIPNDLTIVGIRLPDEIFATILCILLAGFL